MGLFVQLLQVCKTRNNLYKNYELLVKRTFKKQATNPAKLEEVGRLENVKLDGKYDTGQLFLHRIFGYRGVILFPWNAKVYDRDENNSNKQNVTAQPIQSTTDNFATQQHTAMSNNQERQQGSTSSSNDLGSKTQTFYQVLIDNRDCPHIRAQTEAVTFLGNQDSNRSLYAIPGLDYVAHDDIMPYISGEKQPIQHELFDKFLENVPDRVPPFAGMETLKAWQEKNNPWLELSDVHKETTENIRVTVIPFYMGCRESPSASVYWWRYCIRLENLGNFSVQLRERHWRIFSLSGTLETVRGRGVVGQEPILSPRLPAFQYSSHVSLQAPSGHMWGTFRLEREDGYTFDCKIPPFSLESKPEEPTNPDKDKTNNNTTDNLHNSGSIE